MKIQNNNQTSFGAIHIGKARTVAKNLSPNIDIYKITNQDADFLFNLRRTIKMEELMPSLPKEGLRVWQNLFNIATSQAIETKRTGLLLTCNDKPCGLIAYIPKKLNIICTWPTEKDKKVPYAGTILMKMMFEDFLKGPNHLLDLDAVTNGPFSNVAKFMRLGFKQRGGENGIIAMRTNRENIIKTLKKLTDNITIDKTSGSTEIDLSSHLLIKK